MFDDDKNDCKWSPVDLVRALLWFFFWYLNSRGSCGARVFFFLQGLISTKLELVIAGAVERRNKVVFREFLFLFLLNKVCLIMTKIPVFVNGVWWTLVDESFAATK